MFAHELDQYAFHTRDRASFSQRLNEGFSLREDFDDPDEPGHVAAPAEDYDDQARLLKHWDAVSEAYRSEVRVLFEARA